MLLCALVLLVVPEAAAAQGETPPSGYRKWLLGAAAGLAIGVPAYLSEDFGVGSCSSSNCFAPIAATVGAVAGFLLGLELDNSAARKWVRGPAAELEGTLYDVPLVANSMAPVTDGVALIGDEGVARANAVVGVGSPYAARGILATTLLEEHEALLAATASSVVAFHQQVAVRGARRVFGGGGAALTDDGGSQVILGGEGTLRRLRVEGTGVEVTMTEEATTSEGVPARALQWPRESTVIWELAGTRVLARSADDLAELGQVELPGPGRSLVVEGSLGVVAGGESGVSVLDLSAPAAPRLAFHYDGVRYAFDVELAAGTVYVTAGEQGLVMLDATEPDATVVSGVVGNLGEPYAVVSSAGRLFVLDRENRRLHVIEVGASEEAAGS